jgi:hypothetical protein
MQHYSRVECAYRRSAGHQPPLCDTIPELSVPAGELLSLGRLERLERLDHEARPIFDAAVGVGCVHKSAQSDPLLAATDEACATHCLM